MNTIKYVSIQVSAKNSFCGNYEFAVSRKTLRNIAERFTVQFCDRVLIHVCDSDDKSHYYEFNIVDDNRDDIYFTILSRLIELYGGKWEA